MTQICQRCGATNQEQARFCKQCGKALSRVAPSAPRSKTWWTLTGYGLAGFLVVSLIGGWAVMHQAKLNRASPSARLDPTTNASAAVPTTQVQRSAPPPAAPAMPSPTPEPLVIPGLGIELPHLSEPEEIAIGQQVAQQVETQYGVYQNATALQRVERIGQQIAPHSDRPTLTYHFTLLDTDQINAFAAPGGFIFVTRGLLAFADATADDELASVLGHEIGHVARRHGAQRIERLTLALAVIDATVKRNPDWAKIYQNEQTQIAGKVVGEMVLNGWSRNQEFEADHYGVIYMRRAGYDPQAAIRLFTRLEQTFEPNQPGPAEHLLATHPPFADRIARLETVIAAGEP